MSAHTITTAWDDPSLGVEVEVDITYDFTAGAAPILNPPDNADPGWPDEVSFVSATPRIQQEDASDQADLDAWASAWLQGDGYDAAVANAVEINQPDPDAARDARIDDGLTGDAW